ncbi:hypothetical protein [Teredinibacter sp. KSP-S5-2]|uniref:hypothetical protein n=1 Tax=Teredinibacter sp. KSP-S5-2 TaxID=3034506 RepID=UPI002934A93B|nr:hypothetical protein [Teredinibacter sp. KSP-S5-2]WNO07651.1 hypothetical protein P5V12_11685 [Teredinibacter sp. KSP-S5-2]
MRCIFMPLFVALFVHCPATYGQTPDSASSKVLTVIIAEDVASDVQRFLAEKKLPATGITDFGGKYSRRDVVEVILFHQALRLGGFEGTIQFSTQADIRRALRKLSQGKYAAWATTLPDSLIEEEQNLLKSEPLVYDSNYYVGLYTTRENLQLLSPRTLSKLREYCVVSSNLWVADWKTLQAMELPCLHSADRWELILRMLKKGRSQFTMAPFQNTPDMRFVTDEVTLFPVPGIKIALLGKRHWVTSGKHPYGSMTLSYLNKGLDILHSQGTVIKAYRESGTIQSTTDRWIVINKPNQKKPPQN